MQTEYRIVFTATFDGADARDAFYDRLKEQISGVNAGLATLKAQVATPISGSIKRADMTKDEYLVATPGATEQVV
jgi:hypothetical protein